MINRALLLILLLPALLSAQDKMKRDDPDHKEIIAMDELARVRERDALLRLPTTAERRARRALEFEKFTRNVTDLGVMGDDLCAPRVSTDTKGLSKRIEKNSKQLASFLKSTVGNPKLKVALTSTGAANLCSTLSALQPNLAEVTNLQRQDITDLSLFRSVFTQLRAVELLSKQLQSSPSRQRH